MSENDNKSENKFRRKIYFALDESGKLSKNDVCTHFIIGGFIYTEKDFVKQTIRKVEIAVKKKHKIQLSTEIKGSGFNEEAIVDYINGVFDIVQSKIVPIFSVVAKDELSANFTMSESLAYNFFVDNIFHFNSKRYSFTKYASEINILMDERNLKKGELNDLENILKTNYIEKPYTITTYYISSRNADVIRFADLIDHVIYHYFNNPDGEKNKYFKANIKKEHWDRMKRGIINYPFHQSYFDELAKIKEIRKHNREKGIKVINKLKSTIKK